ncbi:hypothetical protein UlMin_035789 [Ulmus minor]
MMMEVEPQFTRKIMPDELSRSLKLLDIKYEGTTDPTDHMKSYRSWMELNGASGAIMCQAFSPTLKVVARHWYWTLRPRSISSFQQLLEAFVSQFVAHKTKRKPAKYLGTLKQAMHKSIESFLFRFVQETMTIDNLNEATTRTHLMNGLREGTILKYLISMKRPTTYANLTTKIRQHINAEKAVALEVSKLSQDLLADSSSRGQKQGIGASVAPIK